MKTLIAVCVLGLGLAACNEHTNRTTKSRDDAVDRTQTTSAIIVDPTLHDSHAPQPAGVTDYYEIGEDENEMRDGG